MNILVLSMISTVIFGMIDSIFFLFFEETIQEKIYKLKLFNMATSELITGSISASCAIFVSSYIRIALQKEENRKLLTVPLLDASGTIEGAIIIVLCYLFYLKFIRGLIIKPSNIYHRSK
jgi:hypothetical protein